LRTHAIGAGTVWFASLNATAMFSLADLGACGVDPKWPATRPAIVLAQGAAPHMGSASGTDAADLLPVSG